MREEEQDLSRLHAAVEEQQPHRQGQGQEEDKGVAEEEQGDQERERRALSLKQLASDQLHGGDVRAAVLSLTAALQVSKGWGAWGHCVWVL